jgi:hypothetical protein
MMAELHRLKSSPAFVTCVNTLSNGERNHADMKADYVCSSKPSLVCVKCITKSKKGHNLTAEDFEDLENDNFEACDSCARESVSLLGEAVQSIHADQSVIDQARQSLSDAAEQIHRRARHLIERVQTERYQLLRRLDSEARTLREAADQHVERVRKARQLVRGMVDLAVNQAVLPPGFDLFAAQGAPQIPAAASEFNWRALQSHQLIHQHLCHLLLVQMLRSERLAALWRVAPLQLSLPRFQPSPASDPQRGAVAAAAVGVADSALIGTWR